MLNLQREVERILEQTGDHDRFITDEQFTATYRLTDDTLVVTKVKKDIVVKFSDDRFEFQRLSFNPGWYPIQVVKGNEVISIVINYENGRAHSARNWHQFLDLAEEVPRKLMGIQPEVLTSDHKQMSDKNVFEQMTLW